MEKQLMKYWKSRGHKNWLHLRPVDQFAEKRSLLPDDRQNWLTNWKKVPAVLEDLPSVSIQPWFLFFELYQRSEERRVGKECISRGGRGGDVTDAMHRTMVVRCREEGEGAA